MLYCIFKELSLLKKEKDYLLFYFSTAEIF